MSSPYSRLSPTPVRQSAACMCATGGSCSTYGPGHALHLIQARLASATPSDWADAVVESVDPTTGDLVVRTVEDGSALVLWNAAGASRAVEPGSPVAVHRRYDVLAVGRRQFNCLAG